jgi:hypothetical protein
MKAKLVCGCEEFRLGMERVIDGVHIVPMGMANAYLIEGDDGLTLIDCPGGIEVIHVPGHCSGQVALLWHPGCMRGRCVHERHEPRRPRRLRRFGGGSREPAQNG